MERAASRNAGCRLTSFTRSPSTKTARPSLSERRYSEPVRISAPWVIADERNQLLRRERRLRDVNAERFERVLNRCDDGSGGRNGADLPGALCAERVERGGGFAAECLDHGHFHSAWQEIIGETRGKRLGVFVIAHPLQNGIADAVCYGAAQLPFDHRGVDQVSRILQRQISGDGDRAGFGIDLDFGDMTGTGIGKGVRAPINIGFEAGIELWRKAIARGSLEDA